MLLLARPSPSFQNPNTNLLQEALQYEGRTITSITFDPVRQPLTAEQLKARLPFDVGSTFHEHELRDAIQNLFASGRFADLAVDAEETPTGVALRFITQNAYFVGHVDISNIHQPPNSGQLISATKLRLGMPFVEADRNQAVESLKNLLRQNGFYHANVSARVEYRPSTEEAHLTFEGKSDGEIAFGALKGFLDVRYGARDGSACAEFSWEGHDENEPACGRGWVMIGTAGRLVGHFYIHNGDDSGFVCERG